MNLKEKNHVLRLALDNINYIVTQLACSPAENIEKEYDCNALAFNEIAKVIANTMRLDIAGGDLPKTNYFTPEAARVFAQAQKDLMDGKSLNEIFANPPFGRAGAPRTPEEEARERFAKWLSVPALGMQFKRLRSKALTKLVASWRDEFNDHIYEICVAPDGTTPNCGWRATATNDGHVVFQLRAKNRTNCEQFALSAMKRYLKRGHRRTYRKLVKSGKEGK